MMQDAVREKAQVTSDLRTVEIEQGSQTPSSQTVEKTQVIPISQSNFGPDMSGSDDEEASEVCMNVDCVFNAFEGMIFM